jgi:hypothetical protein
MTFLTIALVALGGMAVGWGLMLFAALKDKIVFGMVSIGVFAISSVVFGISKLLLIVSFILYVIDHFTK